MLYLDFRFGDGLEVLGTLGLGARYYSVLLGVRRANSQGELVCRRSVALGFNSLLVYFCFVRVSLVLVVQRFKFLVWFVVSGASDPVVFYTSRFLCRYRSLVSS